MKKEYKLIEIDEDEYDKILIQGYELGRINQLEDIGKKFIKSSGELFSKKEDKQATFLRAIGQDLIDQFNKEYNDYRKKYYNE